MMTIKSKINYFFKVLFSQPQTTHSFTLQHISPKSVQHERCFLSESTFHLHARRQSFSRTQLSPIDKP